MHAISIKQPFVEQILQGKKRFEFRSRGTNIRGRVYLYASLNPRTDQPARVWKKLGKRRDELPYGLIVGTVEITRCIERGPKDFAYALRNPVRFKRTLKPKKTPKPQPCFWRPRF